jgi:uncharacterized protein YcfJ
MKRYVLTIVAALAAVAVQAQAQTFNASARVREVQPQYETVQVPRQECTSAWVQDAPAAPSRSYGGVIIGGVVGGVLGNQVGKGHGREAATAAGAVVGALAGDHLANRGAPSQYVQGPAREVRNCQTVYETQQQVAGYRVTYEYQGYQYTTVTRDHPGSVLPVRVSVVPLEREYHRP